MQRLLALVLFVFTIVFVACGEDAGVRGEFGDDRSSATTCFEITVEKGYNFEIFKYEASRPNASSGSTGTGAGMPACSEEGVLPWVNITRGEAGEACQRSGFDLCTMDQWTLGCGGADKQAFPYGMRDKPGYCNEFQSGTGRLEPTGSRGRCVSPYEVYDMIGNVAEWVLDRSDEGAGRYRGYSYQLVALRPTASPQCDSGYHAPLADWDQPYVGFRCCRPF